MSKFYDHKVKYRTLSQLLDAVADEWNTFDREGYMDPSHLIRVVRKVNKELGLRVTQTKEVLIEFDHHVVNLPDDLEQLNFAVLCDEVTITQPAIQGIQTYSAPADCRTGDCKQKVFITPSGHTYVIKEHRYPDVEYTFPILARVGLEDSLFHCDHSEVKGKIISDNFLKLNVSRGKCYLNYEGMLETHEGELLVVDHPLVNDYYEYALKRRILENLYFSGNEEVERKLALIEQRYRQARREALSVVNMPEFQEIADVVRLNREAMYQRYYTIFA